MPLRKQSQIISSPQSIFSLFMFAVSLSSASGQRYIQVSSQKFTIEDGKVVYNARPRHLLQNPHNTSTATSPAKHYSTKQQFQNTLHIKSSTITNKYDSIVNMSTQVLSMTMANLGSSPVSLEWSSSRMLDWHCIQTPSPPPSPPPNSPHKRALPPYSPVR